MPNTGADNPITFSTLYSSPILTVSEPACRIWTIREGKAVRFQQYIDTYKIARSIR